MTVDKTQMAPDTVCRVSDQDSLRQAASSSAPRVGIVVPVYNAAEHLQECLASIAAQTYQPWEVVVVNNCSTDGTGEIADGFAAVDPRFRVVHCKQFLPKCENYNRAVACAPQGIEFLKIVEADNHLLPGCIEQAVDLARSDSEIGIVASYYVQGRVLFGSGIDLQRSVVPGNEVRRDYLLTDVHYLGVPTTLLFRAEALSQVNPYFRTDVFFDDIELCFRVLGRWKFGVVHQVLAFVRDDNNGTYSHIRAFDDFWACRYALAVLFGKEVLAPQELAQVTARRRKAYLECLGRAALGGRSRQYWEFQRDVFRLVGEELSFRALFGPVARTLVDALLNPKSSIERLLRSRRRRKSIVNPVGGDTRDRVPWFLSARAFRKAGGRTTRCSSSTG